MASGSRAAPSWSDVISQIPGRSRVPLIDARLHKNKPQLLPRRLSPVPLRRSRGHFCPLLDMFTRLGFVVINRAARQQSPGTTAPPAPQVMFRTHDGVMMLQLRFLPTVNKRCFGGGVVKLPSCHRVLTSSLAVWLGKISRRWGYTLTFAFRI